MPSPSSELKGLLSYLLYRPVFSIDYSSDACVDQAAVIVPSESEGALEHWYLCILHPFDPFLSVFCMHTDEVAGQIVSLE